jgi:hypothetical protein
VLAAALLDPAERAVKHPRISMPISKLSLPFDSFIANATRTTTERFSNLTAGSEVTQGLISAAELGGRKPAPS